MTADEFSLALLERLHLFDFMELRDADGEVIPPDPEVIDQPLVDQIAEYLISEEELNPNDESEELEFCLRVGVFIYGWEQYRKSSPYGDMTVTFLDPDE